MEEAETHFQPENLWAEIKRRTDLALRNGALEPIQTEMEIIEQEGIRFVVRWISSLARKTEQQASITAGKSGPGRSHNPFQPPDPELTVGEISDTHLAVLNKFYVLDHHLLMVTRRFEHQDTLLTRDDFLAFWMCLAGLDGLGFYNGGRVAGASQFHKHLQMVPLPLGGGGGRMPVDPLFGDLAESKEPTRISAIPWQHRCARLDPSLARNPVRAARHTYALYRSALEALNIEVIATDSGECPSRPYNLLITRDLMYLIPRRRERAQGISVNALGFAGSFFVPSRSNMQRVRKVGPMELLRQVAFSRH